jgi:type I restriction enzyme R subunit
MGLTESDTRAKLIEPPIHARAWTEDLIRREETAGAIEIIDGKPRKQAKGRVDAGRHQQTARRALAPGLRGGTLTIKALRHKAFFGVVP